MTPDSSTITSVTRTDDIVRASAGQVLGVL
jgi:hypothetical protein